MATAKKILVVDDEKEINDSLNEILSGQGHKMYSAFDGNEAIKTVKEEDIDLVFLDMRMPKVDGLQVIRTIKQYKPQIRILVLTGFADTYLEKAKELGVDGFFVKPVRLDTILERMNELLEKKSPPLWSWEREADKIGDHILKAKLLFIEDSNLGLPFIPLDDLIKTGKMQFETQCIYCQNEALNKIKEFKPDIVIMAMSVPMNRTDKVAVHTTDLTGVVLDLQKEGMVKSLIMHTRRDVLEQDYKDKLDQLYDEMKDIPESQLDDYSPQGRRRHFEKLKAAIIAACVKNNLFAK